MYFNSNGVLAKILWWLDEHHFFVIIPVLGILLSIVIFIWCGQRTLPEPEPITKFSEVGDFCSIDIQALSRWIVKVNGDENHSFYFAEDTKGEHYIVSMNDEQYEQFEEIVAFSYSQGQTIRPASIKISGMVRATGEESAPLLAEAFDVSLKEYKEVFGSTFLNLKESPNTRIVTTFIWVFGFSILFLLLRGIALFDEWNEKRKQKSKWHGN